MDDDPYRVTEPAAVVDPAPVMLAVFLVVTRALVEPTPVALDVP
jgi:hypothetical protein